MNRFSNEGHPAEEKRLIKIPSASVVGVSDQIPYHLSVIRNLIHRSAADPYVKTWTTHVDGRVKSAPSTPTIRLPSLIGAEMVRQGFFVKADI